MDREKNSSAAIDKMPEVVDLPRQKILIVDDTPANLFALKKVLQAVDADVVEAGGGQEALAAVLDHDFSLLILDVQMPEMDGYELAGYLRGDSKTKTVPIIFLTANLPDKASVFKGYQSGAFDYITKPYIPEILVSKVQILLEMTSSRHELQQHRDHLQKLVEDRVAELSSARLAALNMMEDALRDKEQLSKHDQVQNAVIKVLHTRISDLQEFLDEALHEAIRLTGSQIGYIYFYNEQEKQFVLNSWSKGVMKECQVMDPQACYELDKTGIWGEAVRQRKPILLNNFKAAHPHKKGVPKGHVELDSFLTVPIFEKEQIVAVVVVANKPSDYDEQDIQMLQLFMDSVWASTKDIKAKQALQASEEMMRSSQAVAHICSYSTHLNTTEIDESQWVCSPEFYNIFGIDETYPHTIAGWAAFIHPDYRDELVAYHESVIREKKSFSKDYKIIRINDGAERWVHGTGELELDEKGNPVRMYGAIQDITEQKQAQDRLAFEQKLFKSFMDTIPASVYFKDTEGTFININKAKCLELDLPPEEIIGKSDVDFMPENQAEKALADERHVMQTEQVIQFEDRNHDQWFFSTKAPRYDETGAVCGTLGISWNITDRKLAEQRIRDEHTLFRNFMEMLPAMVYFKDAEGRYIRLNQKKCDQLGLAEEQIIGKTVYDFFPKEQADLFSRQDLQVMQTGEPIQEEQMVGGVWCLTIKAPRYKETGAACGTLGISWNITDRKLAESALRENQEHLEKMWNAMDVGIALIDAETQHILRINPALEKISGYTQDELIGTVCYEVICPACKDHCPIKDLGQKLEPSERALIHKNGHLVDIEKTVNVILVGGREAYLETMIDVSERKKAEAELRRLSTAIEQSPETVVITDTEGTIQYVNPAFELTTGYSRKEVIGKNPRILKSGQQDPVFYSRLWKTIAAGQIWNGRIINKRKDGSVYTEQAAIAPVRDTQGIIMGYVATKRDITDDLVKEEKFRQSQKMEAVGQLAGGVAHDFNNILQAILGFSDILLDKISSESQEHLHVKEIQKSAQRAAELTRQLLAFSRKQPIEKTEIDLNTTIQDTEVLLKILLGNQINYVFDPDSELHPVYADHGQITQIIMNLAVNGRDAMPDGGRLTIKTRNVTFDPQAVKTMPDAEPGSFVCLSVTDTGTGMSQEVKEHLFEPFFTTKEVGRGTGLGLAVIYGVVKQNKGWIHVYSEENQGTSFNIYLPAGDSSEQNKPHDPKHHERILLVEDSPEMREMVVRILGTAGYETVAVKSAEDALEVFEKNKGRLDLLFSDMTLPGKSGIELADILSKQHPDLPVLLYSGYQDQRERWQNLESKGYRFLQKPFTVASLLAAVHDALTEKTR